MIQTLHIENYALIQHTDIVFDRDFVVITGETGAGKSIILGALGLLVGQRADMQALGDKERKCVVEAQFDISGLGLQPLFEQEDLDYDDNLVLRREILPGGKSRAFANDTPVQLATLKTLGERLIDIHSQHQTITLTNSRFQTHLLDTLGEGKGQVEAYQSAYANYSALKRQLEHLTDEEARNAKEQDYLQFLYDELRQASPQAGEQKPLEDEAEMLSHVETIKQGIASALALCDSEEDGVVARLVGAKGQVAHVSAYHKELPEIERRLESSVIELRDILSELQSIDESLLYSPERQQEVDERLSLLYRLEKKHGVDGDEALVAAMERIGQRLRGMGSIADEIRLVMEEVDKAYAAMQREAERLTLCRRQAAKRLEQSILPTLSQLGMGEARLAVSIVPAADYGPSGHDDITFLFNANRGGEMRPLSKVASGGELSRLMLAVKAIGAIGVEDAQAAGLPTYIFDEIDTGVSGDISIAMGDIMRRMARAAQVVAITHLPQIAAKASQHLKVSKHVDDGADRTVSQMRELQEEDRVSEIAVMLSSNPPTEAAIRTARELMGRADGQ